MCELTMEAGGLPPLTGEARTAFARLTHATAHEAMALQALHARIERDGLTTMAQVHAAIGSMIAERAHRLGLDPDVVSDAYEAASADQKMDMALVRGQVGHA